jgi:hypothetical protein
MGSEFVSSRTRIKRVILLTVIRYFMLQQNVKQEFGDCDTISSSFTGFYKPLAGFSLLILEVSRSHIMHNTVGRTPLDEWSARRKDLYLTYTQHSQQTNIHAPGGIRTRNPSRRATADPRLRPLGHWDRWLWYHSVFKSVQCYALFNCLCFFPELNIFLRIAHVACNVVQQDFVTLKSMM